MADGVDQDCIGTDSISCPICLDLLKEPVTTSCGHSYCMGCIKDCWDQDDRKGIYSCPMCKESFIRRPVLRKNNLLAELVEKLKKTGLHASRPAHFYAGPGDVACDFCIGRKQKARKSCLVCLASYCGTHLKPHYKSPAFKKHKLIEASSQLHERTCSRHGKALEVFCRTDQQCICLVCAMEEHKEHDTVSAATERNEKQRLGPDQSVQERERDMKRLKQAVKSFKRSAQTAEKESERIFTEMICSIERRRSEVKELIRLQLRAAVSQAEGLLEILQKEIAELRRRDSELEKLSHTEDHIHFLQSYQSLTSPSVSADFPLLIVPGLQDFGGVSEAVCQLRDKLEDILKGECPKISTTENLEDVSLPPEPKIRDGILQCERSVSPQPANSVSALIFSIVPGLQYFGAVSETVSKLRETLWDILKGEWPKISTTGDLVDVLLYREPKTRADFLQHSCYLTLDQNTAHKTLSLSEGNRKVTSMGLVQPYPYQQERFTNSWQVLCREGLSGRCYWEVEWSGGVYIAVSYKDIVRTGIDSALGCNNRSWSLDFSSGGFKFRHNAVVTKVPGPQCYRVGVYLDHREGTLSFYSVSDTMTLLHRVQTTFTEPLYPGFWIGGRSSAELCELSPSLSVTL